MGRLRLNQTVTARRALLRVERYADGPALDAIVARFAHLERGRRSGCV